MLAGTFGGTAAAEGDERGGGGGGRAFGGEGCVFGVGVLSSVTGLGVW